MNFDFNRLYLSTEGRIGRGQYWLGAIVLAVISIIVTFLVTRALGGTAYIIFALIWQIIISYLAYNLMAKRFQDRDKPSTYALYAIVALFILTVISLFTTPPPGEMPGAISIIASLLTLAIAIWLLIELGILRGTAGPNQYGPDPVPQR